MLQHNLTFENFVIQESWSKMYFLYVYKAAEKLMGSDDASPEPKRKQKRDAEGDGRDLLVAYLSDVGGYDRNYRDVEDEDESGSSGNKIPL